MGIKLLVLTFALMIALQEEKIELKFSPLQNDKLSKEKRQDAQLTVRVQVGKDTKEVLMEVRGRFKGSVQFLAVADSRPTKAVYEFSECYREQKQVPGSPDWERKNDPLQGRKVTASSRDGELDRVGSDGLTERDLRTIDLKFMEMSLLPRHPVKIGDSWEITGEEADMGITSGRVEDATLKLTLSGIKEIDKKRCAMISGKLESTGKAGAMETNSKMDCEIVLWIERGYILEIKGKGTVKMKGAQGPSTMSGEGAITLNLKTQVE